MTIVYVHKVDSRESKGALARRLHSHYARKLLAYAAKMEYGVDIACYPEKRSHMGKPYLEGAPFHFNLSHSGDYVVCALSDCEVGVDIEKIVPISLKVMRRFFGRSILSPKEQMRLWTRYESYGKMAGIGIPYPAGSEKPCFYREFDDIDRYYLTVCSPKDEIDGRLILVGDDKNLLPPPANIPE